MVNILDNDRILVYLFSVLFVAVDLDIKQSPNWREIDLGEEEERIVWEKLYSPTKQIICLVLKTIRCSVSVNKS